MPRASITLQIDIIKEIAGMSPEARKDLLDELSCDNQVIENVASQILYGLTELGSSGEESCNAIDLWNAPYPTPLDSARRHVAKLAPASMAEEVRRVSEAAIREREHFKEKQREYYEERRKMEDRISELNRQMLNEKRCVETLMRTAEQLQSEVFGLRSRLEAAGITP